MSIADAIARMNDYHRRHGLTATFTRSVLAAKRALFASRMVVFYCDLNDTRLLQENGTREIEVQRCTRATDLTSQHLQQLTEFWNPKIASERIAERFTRGASLWLTAREGRIAAYGWTLRGSTIEPYYFPLSGNDIHFFDFHVFPEFRGHGLNPSLVRYIVRSVANEGGGRAFIEAAEWNNAQLRSLEKTPFRRLGTARSSRFFRQGFTSWEALEPKGTDSSKAHATNRLEKDSAR